MSAELRIAWRSSDQWVTAFLADMNTMEGSIEILRVRKTALDSDPRFWEQLQAVVQASVHRLIEEECGIPVDRWERQRPPEEPA